MLKQKAKAAEDNEKGLSFLYEHLMKVQRDWSLDAKTLSKLIRVSPSLLCKYADAGSILRMDETKKEILQNIFSIHRSLSAIFGNTHNAQSWLHSPNPDLNGRIPLELCKESLAMLFTVRQYLDFIRGRGV